MTAVELLASGVFAIMVERAEPSSDLEAIRLGDIAHTIAVTASREPDPAASASLLLAISWHESGWREDVDDGRVRADRGGSSCSLWMINAGRDRCRALLADRLLAADTALELAERSLNACRRQARAHRLAAYASGSCSKGHRESARMIRTFDRWRPRLVAAVEATS